MGLLFLLLCARLAAAQQFSNVSFHVSSFVNHAATTEHVAVFFAGWSVVLDDAQVWASHVVARTLNARTVFVVAGPEDSEYARKEIDTAGLARAVLSVGRVNDRPLLTVVAHSSGGFVAYVFFSSLFEEPSPFGSVAFFALDSGVTGLTDDMVGNLTALIAVNAKDTVSGIESRNYDAMAELAERAPPKTSLYTCAVETKCAGPTGYNCMHDALIVHSPFNASTFDLHDDYNVHNTVENVQTDYLLAWGDAPSRLN
jgi:hypothetical protein